MDIREILQSLDEQDRLLWSQCRTDMRRAYLIAHNKALGLPDWNHEDDAFMDMIDIKIATLFDRSGSFDASKNIIGKEDAAKIESDLTKHDDGIKDKLKLISNGATQLPQNEWPK